MNVASDVVQLGQPPNGTGGKKKRHRKRGTKNIWNKQGQALSWSEVDFYGSEKNGLGPSSRQGDTPWKFNVAPENIWK